MHGDDRVKPRAVRRDDVVGVDCLEGLHRFRHDLIGRWRQVEAADDRVHLLDPRHLLDLTHGIDDTGMAAGGNYHKPSVLHVVGRRVLALEGVSDQLRSEEHTSELQSLAYLVCRLLLEKKKKKKNHNSAVTETS